MKHWKSGVTAATAALLIAGVAAAEHSPQHARHELMEGVGKAAKVIGGMLRGDTEYDAAAAQESLAVWQDASGRFGDMFPEGSETGEDTEAAPAIWEDRDGFDAALAKWSEATAAAIEAAPATLEDGKPVLGAVFQTCKNCHDTYRIEKE